MSARRRSIDLSVVVPTYKGAASLRELITRRTEAFLGSRKLHGEIVLVNDASPDDSWSIIEELAVLHSSVVAIDLMSNEGQALATLCGIAHARGRLVATMDDDLQQSPEELGKLVDALDEHPDWDADSRRLAARPGNAIQAVRELGSTRASIITSTGPRWASDTRRSDFCADRSLTR